LAHHIEDISVKFALQNYAATGAVFLAYFTGHMSLRMSTAVAFLLSVIFTIAILVNVGRYQLFWKMHRIARDHWLSGQSTLRDAYRTDTVCDKYLKLKALPVIRAFGLVILINVLPAFAAVFLYWRRS
jgi:hypothetical protein